MPKLIIYAPYPFGKGNKNPLALKFHANIGGIGNSVEVVEAANNIISTAPYKKYQEITNLLPCGREEAIPDIDFIGYSGGGQIAYSTAQQLTGHAFVKNLVMLGSPFRAYNKTNNIGQIWDVVGQDDDTKYSGPGWDDFNHGMRYVRGNPSGYYEKLDLYRQGGGIVRCNFYGPNYVHAGDGDYFEGRNDLEHPYLFEGADCGRMKYNLDSSSRLNALVDFLVTVVGIGR